MSARNWKAIMADRLRLLLRVFRGLLLLVLVAGALLLAGNYFAVNQLEEEIRAYVQWQLAEHYGALEVSVRSAQRIEGEGIEIRGVTLVDPRIPGDAGQLVSIDEIFATCQADLPDLLTGQLHIEQLHVRRMKIRAARHGDGSWNLQQLLPLPQLSEEPPGTVIEDATIELVDGTSGRKGPLVLRQVNLTITPAASAVPPAASGAQSTPTGAFAIDGTLVGDHFRRLTVRGQCDLEQGVWAVRGSVEGLEVSARMFQALPGDLAQGLAGLGSLRARAALDFQIRHDRRNASPWRYALSGSLTEGQLDDGRLPYPLTDLRAQFYWDQQGLRVDNLTARSGPGAVRLSYQRDSFQPDSPWLLRATARDLALDRRLAGVLPEASRELWERFSPTGVVNAELTVQCDGQQWRPELFVECLDVSFLYDRFAYRVSGGRGTIHLKEDVLKTEGFQVQVNGRDVQCDLEIRHPGPHYTGWVEIASDEPIALEEPWLAALPDPAGTLIRSLQPGGLITFWGRFERHDGQSRRLDRHIKIGLHNCSVKYEKFPYPLERIRGTLSLRQERWEFRDLQGYNESGYVVCNGSWDPGQGQLALDFVGTDIALEDGLRHALNPPTQRLWNQIRPRGTLDHLKASVRYQADRRDLSLDVQLQKWPPGQNIEGRSITVEPSWLPYRMDEVTGTVRFANGVVELEDLRAVHGRSRLQLAGQCTVSPEGQWGVHLSRLTADRLAVDRDLIAALPPQLSQAVDRLNLTGPVNMNGWIQLAGHKTPGTPVRSQWDLMFDVENGSLQCGVRLDHIHGGIRLVGSRDQRGFHSRGELHVDSLVYQQFQLTRVRGPLWIDPQQILFGSWAERGRTGQPPRQITAQVVGGSLVADARIALDDEGRFAWDCSLSDGDLAQIAQEAMNQKPKISGKAFALLRMQGTNKGTHTWRGEGLVRLRQADIYELPLMVALLKLLSVRPPDTTAFTTSNMDFRIQGEHIYFERIDFNGDVISLKGNGEMNLQRQIKLNFYTQVGRDEWHLPLLRPVLGEASRQILLIHVDGSLQQPQLTKKAFPALNDTLQQLFPELR